jgi:hypothetical protein
MYVQNLMFLNGTILFNESSYKLVNVVSQDNDRRVAVIINLQK